MVEGLLDYRAVVVTPNIRALHANSQIACVLNFNRANDVSFLDEPSFGSDYVEALSRDYNIKLLLSNFVP